MSQPKSIFGPLLLIAAGAIWLLIQSGNLPSGNLWALTYIWPYLLIAAGVGLILRPYWQYINIVLDVLIIGGAVLAIVYAPQLGWDNPSINTIFIDDDFNVGPGERGSGNIIVQTREVESFDSITIEYPAQVFITQGETESVKVEADDDFLAGLQTRVRGNTLEISYRVQDGKRINPTEPLQITIVVRELKEVDFETAGELTLDGIKTDSLDIAVSGAGNLKLNDLTAKDLSVNLSGAGSMTASGTTDKLDVVISGFGDFKGDDLHGKTASVNISGAGSASVWVDDQLDAQISGAGSINYYGSPEVDKQISGVGSVNKSGNK
jgi:hypothetical protein